MEFRQFMDFGEACPVCGDKVSGYHYGLLTCESCKGFFKRTVQNDKKYVCAENQACSIDKTQRKRCAFCRFQKCLRVGMRLEAVRADRMRGGRNKFGPLYKRDRALKQQRQALIQACGYTAGGTAPLVCAFTDDLQPGSVLHRAPPQDDCIAYRPPSSVCPLPPSGSPGAARRQCVPFSNPAIKSHHGASSPGELCSGLPRGPWMPQLVMEFLLCDPDELQLQNKITACLQQELSSLRKQGNLSTFSHLCLMADQTLFSIVEWARSSIYFRQLKVSDQMKLLHGCWSELLILDIVSRQVMYGKDGSLLLVTGQEVQLSHIASHTGPSLDSLVQRGQRLIERLHTLKADRQEFACIKFLILFNPDVKELEEHQHIQSVQEQAEGALLEYTLRTSAQYLGRLASLLLCLSELRSLSTLAEDYLHCRHLSGEVPCNNLLAEMLHAKCGWP